MKTSSSRSPLSVDPSWRIGIVYSSFYTKEIDMLRKGARSFLEQSGIPSANISDHPVAGSFEIPLIGKLLADAGAVDALIGLGIIVEGETHHARLLADATAAGMMRIQLEQGMPFAFEVLYVDELAQAVARSAASGNKGEEAAYAVLHSLMQLKAIRSPQR